MNHFLNWVYDATKTCGGGGVSIVGDVEVSAAAKTIKTLREVAERIKEQARRWKRMYLHEKERREHYEGRYRYMRDQANRLNDVARELYSRQKSAERERSWYKAEAEMAKVSNVKLNQEVAALRAELAKSRRQRTLPVTASEILLNEYRELVEQQADLIRNMKMFHTKTVFIKNPLDPASPCPLAKVVVRGPGGHSLN